MARSKSFTTYAPTDSATFQINGQQFRLKPSIPGAVLLDFLGGADESKPQESAKLIAQIMEEALVPEDWDRWNAFIRDPKNNVTLATLMDVTSFVAEEMSGNPTEASPQPFMPS